MSTPLAAIGKGLVAGAVGTAAMTAYQGAVAKARDSESSTTPAEVGKRVIRGVFQRSFDESRTEELNNAVHGFDLIVGAEDDGFEALMAGDERVVSASLKTKLQGRGSRLMPDSLKAELHRKMAEPGSGEDD